MSTIAKTKGATRCPEKSIYALILMFALLLGGCHNGGRVINVFPSVNEEDLRVKKYMAIWGYGNNSDNTIRISFDDNISSYSISSPELNKVIVINVYYVKTFGGAPPGVRVYLINNRFVAYPETIKDSWSKDSIEMKAITNVYDLKTGYTFSSDSYTYDHDVPLVLPITKLLMIIEHDRYREK